MACHRRRELGNRSFEGRKRLVRARGQAFMARKCIESLFSPYSRQTLSRSFHARSFLTLGDVAWMSPLLCAWHNPLSPFPALSYGEQPHGPSLRASDLPSLPTFFPRGGLADPQLRALRKHILIVRPQRAQEINQAALLVPLEFLPSPLEFLLIRRPVTRH